MPSSSPSSRFSAANGASPGWHFPPGNSHQPASGLPRGRRFTSHRPLSSLTRPTTTSTVLASLMLLGNPRRGTSTQAAVTLLEFLAGTARTWVVAADLRRLAHERRDRLRGRRRRPHARVGTALPRLGRRR